MNGTNAHYHHTKDAIAQEELLIRAAQKDPKAFAPLYDKYYVQIFRFVLKRMGNEQDASDITSQVFIKAITNIKKYQFRGVPFTSWLHMVARNEVNLGYRSKKYDRTVDVQTEHLHGIVDEFDTDEIQNSSDDKRIPQLLSEISQLKLEEIELLEMRYFEKRPFKEVSEILGISESNAKVRMHRIIKKLKDLMLEQNG
ncbi:MAG: sigma-70 family RNA polymerase sigma factor [Flavobacteriales bacterium]|nr:sigma-70 family RNA polymerase sigma factor [Flavobacteriales bacterium]